MALKRTSVYALAGYDNYLVVLKNSSEKQPDFSIL
jgi:hypothetical protein